MYFAIAMAGVSAYSAYMSSVEQNKSARNAQDEALYRQRVQDRISEGQIVEQKQNAFMAMSEVAQQKMVSMSKQRNAMSESGVTGNVAKRVESVNRLKFTQASNKVQEEATTNIINIANKQLANKIDTEAILREAESKKKSSLSIATDMAIQGYQGYSIGSSLDRGISSLQSNSTNTSGNTDRKIIL